MLYCYTCFQCCMCLQIVHSWFPYRFSVTFIFNIDKYILRYTKTSGVIVYDDGGSNNNFVLETMPDASFGALVDWSSARRVNRRSYSIEASGAKSELTYLHVKTRTSIKINSEGQIYAKIFWSWMLLKRLQNKHYWNVLCHLNIISTVLWFIFNTKSWLEITSTMYSE